MFDARPVYSQDHLLHHDRNTRIDLKTSTPTGFVDFFDEGFHLGFVITEGAQSGSGFANGALLQTLDEISVEIVAALVALEAEIGEHVAPELAVHTIDLDVDVGAGGPAGYHRP